jgi:hypothetical protein
MPTPSPSRKNVTALQIGGKAITILGSGGVRLGEVSYSVDGENAVRQLADAIGVEPVISDVTAGLCSSSHKLAQWGSGLQLRYAGESIGTPGRFFISSTARESYGQTVVQVDGGSRVGDPIAPVIAMADRANVDHWGEGTQSGTSVWIDLDSTGVGVDVTALPDNGPIVSIAAPLYRLGDC